MKKIDVFCAGEILADIIGDVNKKKLDTGNYKLVPGGSPANVANNLAHLGNKVAMIGALGEDSIGDFLLANLKKSGVVTSYVKQRELPTTLILVNASKGTPDFEAYRMADKQLTMAQVDARQISKAKIFHTTCFGLSMEPARSTIIAAAKMAKESGVQMSIDLNYAVKIWPKRKKAKRIVDEYLSMGALVKVSDVDFQRLYDRPIKSVEKVLDFFLKKGATQVCFTQGDKGVWVADQENESYLPARKIKVVDTTGAGDAFWSGYLSAWLKGASIVEAAKMGRAVAEYKLGRVGSIDKQVLDYI